jgi:hypothetical protein
MRVRAASPKCSSAATPRHAAGSACFLVRVAGSGDSRRRSAASHGALCSWSATGACARTMAGLPRKPLTCPSPGTVVNDTLQRARGKAGLSGRRLVALNFPAKSNPYHRPPSVSDQAPAAGP